MKCFVHVNTHLGRSNACSISVSNCSQVGKNEKTYHGYGETDNIIGVFQSR